MPEPRFTKTVVSEPIASKPFRQKGRKKKKENEIKVPVATARPIYVYRTPMH